MNAAQLTANLRMPCGTDSARRRHLAHGKRCERCWPYGLPEVPSRAEYAAAVRGAA